jgi:thiamine-monophosphate kinase
MKKTADAFGTTIVGGDIAAGGNALVISVTIVGVPGPAGAITRSGARPGDVIFVTGEIGGSMPGKHLRFQPRIREALELARKCPIHAMIDISDGLAADLQHILEESRVGAVLSAKDIPISRGRPTIVHRPSSIIADRSCEIRRALAQGEDYELLFTVPPRAADAVPTKVCGVRVSRIGHIIAKRKMMLDTGGELRVIKPGGWVHKLG